MKLNVKTAQGSILKSIITIDDLLAQHKEGDYCLICDDTMMSSLQFYRKAKAKGIKPIIGLELEVKLQGEGLESEWFFVFAKNNVGFQILVDLQESLLVLFEMITSPNLLSISSTNALSNGNISLEPVRYLTTDDRQGFQIIKQLNEVDVSEGQAYEGQALIDEFTSQFEDYQLDSQKVSIPPTGFTEEDFKYVVTSRFEALNFHQNQKYVDRFNYELKVITEFGYTEYFMLVYDLIRHCNENLSGYYSAGRGSVGGSLIAYLLGITRINPVEPDGFNIPIPFDRFINSGRKTMPDIDMDFLPQDREYIIEYLRFKYGNERVMNIATINTLGARAAIREVARITGRLTPQIDGIIKSFPHDQSLNLQMIRDSDIYDKNKDNQDFVDLFEQAEKFEGIPRNIGVHASGIALASKPFIELGIPTFIHPNSRKRVTQYEQEDLDYLGVIKLDVLGLNTLQNIKGALDIIPNFTFEDLKKIPIDSSEVYDLINSGDTAGIFQWDTYNYKKVISQLRPKTFKDLVDLNTLGRSAALLSGLTESYIKRRNGQEDVVPIHPKLKGIMSETYELPLYQEQIMYVFTTLANYSMAEADDVRKAMGKKLPELLLQQKVKFSDRAQANGITIEDVERIWAIIDKFSKYTWNLGHAMAYTRICYETAYLAAFYPVYYYSSCALGAGDSAETQNFISQMKKREVNVIKAHILQSNIENTILDASNIRLGLAGIKKVGKGALEKIGSEMAKQKFISFQDFVKRTKSPSVNRSTIKALLCAGAFDDVWDLQEIKAYLGITDDEYKNLRLNQYSLSGRIAINPQELIECQRFKDLRDTDYVNVGCYIVDMKEIYTKAKHEKMCFLTVEDFFGRYEITIFPKNYKEIIDINQQLSIGEFVILRVGFEKGFIGYSAFKPFRNMQI